MTIKPLVIVVVVFGLSVNQISHVCQVFLVNYLQALSIELRNENLEWLRLPFIKKIELLQNKAMLDPQLFLFLDRVHVFFETYIAFIQIVSKQSLHKL